MVTEYTYYEAMGSQGKKEGCNRITWQRGLNKKLTELTREYIPLEEFELIKDGIVILSHEEQMKQDKNSKKNSG